MRRILLGVGVMTTAALAGWSMAGSVRPVAAEAAANTPAFYTEKVMPIWQAHCEKCHLGMNHKGGLVMSTKAGMMKGGRDGIVVVPGDPANSMLVKLIRHEGPPDDPKPMPPKEPKMTDADIAIVEQWIKAGAVMPDDPPPAQ